MAKRKGPTKEHRKYMQLREGLQQMRDERAIRCARTLADGGNMKELAEEMGYKKARVYQLAERGRKLLERPEKAE